MKEKLEAFLKLINARLINESGWDIEGGQTTLSWYSGNNARQFVVMKMVQDERITSLDIFIPATNRNDIDEMFKSVEEYVTNK